MKRLFKLLTMGVVLCAVAACSSSKIKTYEGAEVTGIVVQKEKRKLHLMSDGKALRSYEIGLGNEPVGQKTKQGDGKTPEGHYFINRRNPNSRYHLSLGISYPDRSAWQLAREAGNDPGGDIFIHGRGRDFDPTKGDDWTAGCIAVTDREIEEIYAMVRDGTPISIYP